MINSALNDVSAPPTLQDRPARSAEAELAPRNPEIADGGGGQDAPERGIANLVRLNISFETAIEQSKQIKTLLSAQLFSIANDEPLYVSALLR